MKEEGGDNIEVIIISDNPDNYNLYKADVIVRLPRRIGFTRAVNIGEKFAKNELIWWMDDSAMPEEGWFDKAVREYQAMFPDGYGYLGFNSGEIDHHNCCARGITSKKTAYSLNGQNLIWPEYIHSGDEEFTKRCHKKNWFKLSTIKVKEVKPIDDTYCLVHHTFRFDTEIHKIRERANYPMTLIPEWFDILNSYPELQDIKENILCQNV
jgi:hypothetical protein